MCILSQSCGFVNTILVVYKKFKFVGIKSSGPRRRGPAPFIAAGPVCVSFPMRKERNASEFIETERTLCYIEFRTSIHRRRKLSAAGEAAAYLSAANDAVRSGIGKATLSAIKRPGFETSKICGDGWGGNRAV